MNPIYDEADRVLSEDALADAPAAAPIPEGITMVNGQPHLTDTKGRLVNQAMVQPFDLLMDETVRNIVRFTRALHDQIARFKQHTLDDVLGLKALLAQDHNVTIGGEKGNITLTTFDGLMKVSLKVADLTIFGPELQAAKAKVTECITGWSEGAKPELIALVNNAFQVDEAGKINRANLLYLLRLAIPDPTWCEAMELIRKAERPIGTKEYVTVHVRDAPGARWRHLTIDVAAA